MFAIAKNKMNSQAVFQRIHLHDITRLKNTGVVLFEDERMAEYATCYINKIEPGVWTQNIYRHGGFNYDTKYKKDLYVANDQTQFQGLWVAFMFKDISYQLKCRGIEGDRLLASSSPYDLPLTPWVIIKLNAECFFLVSASDGRVVGASHRDAAIDFGDFINSIGGALCGYHMDVLTLKEAM